MSDLRDVAALRTLSEHLDPGLRWRIDADRRRMIVGNLAAEGIGNATVIILDHDDYVAAPCADELPIRLASIGEPEVATARIRRILAPALPPPAL